MSSRTALKSILKSEPSGSKLMGLRPAQNQPPPFPTPPPVRGQHVGQFPPSLGGPRRYTRTDMSLLDAEIDILEEGLIEETSLQLFSKEELIKMSGIEIYSADDTGPHTLNDQRMGCADTGQCQSCNRYGLECVGHLGYIVLNSPIYHPLYLREIIAVLSSVCRDCSKLRLPPGHIKSSGLMRFSGKTRLMEIAKESLKFQCSNRDCRQNPEYITSSSKTNGNIMYKDPNTKGTDLKAAQVPMKIKDVIEILKGISQEDTEVLGFENGTHPIRMILQAIAVLPPRARPAAEVDGLQTINPLTQAYRDIIKINNALKVPIASGDTSAIIDQTMLLVKAITKLIEGSDTTMDTTRELKGAKQMLQGKEGIVRQYIQAKRVNFSARTVVSPDPTLQFGQVRIPEVMAPYLTVPVTVFDANREELTRFLRTGKVKYITPAEDDLDMNTVKKHRFTVLPSHIERYELKIGDLVERHLKNGDYVIFNRQPTLHRQSMMGGEVVLGKPLTIGIPLPYTSPLNADFDGDELNIHAVQTLGSIAELEGIVNVKDCIMNSQNNKPIMGLVMDSLTGALLLSDPDTVIDKYNFYDYMLMLQDGVPDLISLNERLERHSVKPYTGRALFSAFLPPDLYYNRGDVLIIDGVLVHGKLGKSTLGNSSNSLIQIIWNEYGATRVARFITDTYRVIDRWLTNRGFSIGIQDCLLKNPEEGEKQIETILEKSRVRVRALGEKFADPLSEERRQKQISMITNEAQAKIGEMIVKEQLNPDNAFKIMIESGAKGAPMNIAQISGALGQQFFMGERIKPSLTGMTRTLPYFPDDIEIESRGFVTNSLIKGLTPAEMFMHSMASRQGLMDTALKTADSGSMHHQIVKVMEDMKVAYDGSVRDSRDVIYQFAYGEDGFEPRSLLITKTNVGSIVSFIDIDYASQKINSKYGFY